VRQHKTGALTQTFRRKRYRLRKTSKTQNRKRFKHQTANATTGKSTSQQRIFFSSSLADVALWLGPYMSISGKTSLCTRTKTVWKCRQITTTTTTHNPARRPANPPARLAFRQEKQQTRQTKGAGAQTKTTTKKICQRTQWFNHCIILKNMRK
jgi:hypothetical protein